MPYTPDATDVAAPPDTGVLAATAAAEFRTIKAYLAEVLLAAINTKVTSGGALGTPTSGTLTNCDGYPVAALENIAAGIAAFLTTPSSANLRTALTDESGDGALLFAGGALGTPASGTLTNATGLPAAGVVGTAAILGSNTFTGAQILSDQLFSRAMQKDCGLTRTDKGNSGTALQTLDYTDGSHQTITATGNFTLATSNWPPTGNLGLILLEAVNFGAYTVTWPTVNCIKPDGTTTTSIATYLGANNGRTAFQSAGTDFILLWSRDAGTTIYMKLV